MIIIHGGKEQQEQLHKLYLLFDFFFSILYGIFFLKFS